MNRLELLKPRKLLWMGFALAICLLSELLSAADIIQPAPINPHPGQSNYQHGNKGPNGGTVFYLEISGLHGLEAKVYDENMTMTWQEAVAAVKAQAPGWRLPTSAELLLLYEHRKLIGGLSVDDYWSSTEQDVNSAWIQGFRTGDQDRYNKHSKLKVRFIHSF
jgi:Protein of unknown function (DUF1566)